MTEGNANDAPKTAKNIIKPENATLTLNNLLENFNYYSNSETLSNITVGDLLEYCFAKVRSSDVESSDVESHDATQAKFLEYFAELYDQPIDVVNLSLIVNKVHEAERIKELEAISEYVFTVNVPTLITNAYPGLANIISLSSLIQLTKHCDQAIIEKNSTTFENFLLKCDLRNKNNQQIELKADVVQAMLKNLKTLIEQPEIKQPEIKKPETNPDQVQNAAPVSQHNPELYYDKIKPLVAKLLKYSSEGSKQLKVSQTISALFSVTEFSDYDTIFLKIQKDYPDDTPLRVDLGLIIEGLQKLAPKKNQFSLNEIAPTVFEPLKAQLQQDLTAVMTKVNLLIAISLKGYRYHHIQDLQSLMQLFAEAKTGQANEKLSKWLTDFKEKTDIKQSGPLVAEIVQLVSQLELTCISYSILPENISAAEKNQFELIASLAQQLDPIVFAELFKLRLDQPAAFSGLVSQVETITSKADSVSDTVMENTLKEIFPKITPESLTIILAEKQRQRFISGIPLSELITLVKAEKISLGKITYAQFAACLLGDNVSFQQANPNELINIEKLAELAAAEKNITLKGINPAAIEVFRNNPGIKITSLEVISKTNEFLANDNILTYTNSKFKLELMRCIKPVKQSALTFSEKECSNIRSEKEKKFLAENPVFKAINVANMTAELTELKTSLVELNKKYDSKSNKSEFAQRFQSDLGEISTQLSKFELLKKKVAFAATLNNIENNGDLKSSALKAQKEFKGIGLTGSLNIDALQKKLVKNCSQQFSDRANSLIKQAKKSMDQLITISESDSLTKLKNLRDDLGRINKELQELLTIHQKFPENVTSSFNNLLQVITKIESTKNTYNDLSGKIINLEQLIDKKQNDLKSENTFEIKSQSIAEKIVSSRKGILSEVKQVAHTINTRIKQAEAKAENIGFDIGEKIKSISEKMRR